jgi:hypothetical protein
MTAHHILSRGASDAGSGVATILEKVFVLLYDKQKHKKMILSYSLTEELGLERRSFICNPAPMGKEIGLVLNFEARGSSGPSYMLMETNKKCSTCKEFAAAKATFPVSIP